jgi:hypothetical protein
VGIASIERSGGDGDGGGGGKDPENPENTKVNNASRSGNERVLKSILVIRGIKKYQSILLCHLT